MTMTGDKKLKASDVTAEPITIKPADNPTTASRANARPALLPTTQILSEFRRIGAG